MPWKESSVMSLKKEFLDLLERRACSMTQLCKEFSISRKTGYKWLKRYNEYGLEGLADSRCVSNGGRQVYSEHIWELIFEVQKRFPTWGPKKITAYLNKQNLRCDWPSMSMIKKRFKQENITRTIKTTPKYIANRILRAIDAPNDVWSIDFKGWFSTSDHKRCEPLTLLDGYSRYLFLCKPVMRIQLSEVWPLLEKVFEECGKPLRIHSDNGAPFGSSSSILSTFDILLLKHGILPTKSRPGHPQDNGRLERIHRTINEDVIKFGSHTLAEYVSRFASFQNSYNTVRPHESLEFQCPADIYHKSERAYSRDKIEEHEYEEGLSLHRVTTKGYINYLGTKYFVSEGLRSEVLGIGEDTGEGRNVVYRGYPLGKLENFKTFVKR